MNKQRFTKVIREPEKLKDEVAELEELKNIHPYAQSLHILLALAHKQRKTNEAGNLLNIAALYTVDRHNLRELIDSNTVKTNKGPAKISTIEEKKEKEIPQPQSAVKAIPENKRDTEHLPVQEKPKVDIVVNEKEIGTGKADKPLSSESVSVSTPPVISPKTSSTTEKVKFTYQSSDPDEGDKMRKDLMEQLKELQISKELWREKLIPDVKPPEKDQFKKDTTEQVKQPKVKDNKAGKKVKATEKKAPSAKNAEASKKSKTTKEPNKEKGGVDKPKVARVSKVKKQQELITKFIEISPSIKAKANNPPIISSKQEDLSIPSTSFSDNLISENLAEIMITQGKTDKAIDIYKKLIWKFPQKKAYFAARIEELNKQQG